nr:hypothetical protein CFP56_33333 [Quercus suber]
MANQVALVLSSGNFGMDIFPSAMNSGFMTAGSLPNVGVQTVGTLPTSVLPNVGVQPNIVFASQNHVGHPVGVLICKLVLRFHCLRLYVRNFSTF